MLSQHAFSQDDFWEAINQKQFSSIQPSAIIDSIESYHLIDNAKAKNLIQKTEEYLVQTKNPVVKYNYYKYKFEFSDEDKIYADSAVHYAELANDSLLLARSYIMLGKAYNGIQENEKALKLYNKVLEFKNCKEEIFDAYIQSANLFLDSNNYEDAKYYLAKCKPLLKNIDRQFHYQLYSLYGYIYLNTEKLDSSKYYYTKYFEICEEFNMKRYALVAQENLGIIEHELGNVELAENIFFNILDKAEKMNDKKLMLFVYTDLVYLYVDLKDDEKAIMAGKEQLKLANKPAYIKYKGNSAKLLYELYEKKEDYANAFKYLKIYKSASDSLLNIEKISKLTELKVTDQFKEQHLIDSLQVANTNIKLSAEKHKREKITWLFALALLATLVSVSQFFRTKRAQKRSDELLLNILPKTTAEELKKTGATTSKRYDNVSILFADLKNFTSISSKLSPEQLVEMLDFYFSNFDVILKKWNVEKIKTIGDAYMAVYGIDKTYSTQTINIVQAALEMQKFIIDNQHPHITSLTNETLAMRIGIHTGSLVAGVVGKTKFQFDVWGDAVNIASRIETSGEPGKVNISIDTFKKINNNSNLEFSERGSIKIKNRGEIEMFFVNEKETPLVNPKRKIATT